MSVLRRIPVAAPVLLALSPLAAGIAQAQEQLEEIIVTARLRSESFHRSAGRHQSVHGGGDRLRGHPDAARLHRADAEHDGRADAEPRQLVHHDSRRVAGTQQRHAGRGRRRRRADDEPRAVQPGAVRHRADRGAEGSAGRALRAQRHRRRRLDRDESADGRLRGETAPRRRFGPRRHGAGHGQRAARRWRRVEVSRFVVAPGHRRLSRERISSTTKADPYQDMSARVRFTWEPNDNLTGDFRYARSDIETTALHFVINDDWRTLGGFVGVPNPGQYHGLTVAPADVNNVNYTGVPIRVNNPGEGLKDMDEVSMKFDVATDAGTFTSITAYDDLHELLTGDAFDFRPIGQSFNEIFFPVIPESGFSRRLTPNPFFGDWNQAQYLEVSSYSQEFRFTSSEDNRVRWIAGAYFLDTERFIGTGNLLDTNAGVARVYKVPRTTTGFPFDLSIPNPQVTYLSDSQDNFAWAVFGQLGFDLGEEWDATLALRYDEDEREQTTETPPGLHSGRSRQRSRHGPEAHGDVGRDAAEAHAALAAEREQHDLRRHEPRLPQRRLQPVGRRARGRRRRVQHVRRADRGHVRDRVEEAVRRRPREHQPRVLHDGLVGGVLLHLPRRVEHAEPGQPRRGRVRRPRVRVERAADGRVIAESRRGHDEQRDHGRRPDPARRRPGSAADVRLHVQPRHQLGEADGERPRVRHTHATCTASATRTGARATRLASDRWRGTRPSAIP